MSCDPVEISVLGLHHYPTHSTHHRSNATSPLAHYPISVSRTWILSFRHWLSHPVFTCKTHQHLPDHFIDNSIRPMFTLASRHTLPTSCIYLQLAATFASCCYQPFYHLFIDYCAFLTWLHHWIYPLSSYSLKGWSLDGSHTPTVTTGEGKQVNSEHGALLRWRDS